MERFECPECCYATTAFWNADKHEIETGHVMMEIDEDSW